MLTIAAALPAWAATVTWNVAGSGDWDTTTGNWTGGSPTDNLYVEGDAAVFSNTAGGLDHHYFERLARLNFGQRR